MVPTDSISLHQVKVLLPVAVGQGFDYVTNAPSPPLPGSYVSVPFGKKTLVGVVWDDASGDIPPEKCRPITTIHDELPSMPEHLRRFITWMAWYNCEPLGAVLKLFLSVPDAIRTPETEQILRLNPNLPEYRRTLERQKAIEYIEKHGEADISAVMEKTSVSRAVINGLITHNILIMENKMVVSENKPFQYKPFPLSGDQQQAVKQLAAPKGFDVAVLEGVTGSGKTEVYFDAIERTLEAGRQVLVMLPEIALGVQWKDRFTRRFGHAPDMWHSGISPAQRRRIWQQVCHGHSRLVVGARSALFLPFTDLGLIIVDEEHDPSYKQEDITIYNGRDMAVMRAKHEDCPVLLVSATPSAETLANIQDGRYRHVRLTSRYGDALLPESHLIDMRLEKLPATEWLSHSLKVAIAETLTRSEQSLLFLNRRGYAPLMLCRACGHRFACPECSSWLVLHRYEHNMQCHHCGHMVPATNTCPSCGVEDKLAPCGPGVERIEEEALAAFPDARILTIASDTSRNRGALEKNIRAITEHKADIIIGTQLLAKGHHFPSLTTVGIIDADIGLNGGDLRATERTYQLLHQLSGRAGRETTHGRVYIQTYQPEHPVMQALASHDGDTLMQRELDNRRAAGMPPYGRLAAIILECKNEDQLTHYARALAASIPAADHLSVLGPAPAPLYRLRSYFRYRFLIKATKECKLQAFIHDWLARCAPPSAIKCKIDIDPYSFM